MSAEFPIGPQVRPWTRGMRFVRRLHLYSGLFLIPFVLLYGVTGFLFNHPEIASERTRTPVTPALTEGTVYAESVAAEEIAQKAVAAFNRQLESEVSAGGGHPGRMSMASESNASFHRGIFATAQDATDAYTLIIQPDSKVGRITTRPRRTERRGWPLEKHLPPLALKGGVSAATWRQGAAELFTRTGAASTDKLRLRGGPVVEFHAECDGQALTVRYDFEESRLQARPRSSDSSSLGLRSFLLRMHLSHLYPDETGTRWLWALLVDLLSICMVTWATSGIFMWWQVKKTRFAGAIVVITSLIFATLIGIAMYREIAN